MTLSHLSDDELDELVNAFLLSKDYTNLQGKNWDKIILFTFILDESSLMPQDNPQHSELIEDFLAFVKQQIRRRKLVDLL